MVQGSKHLLHSPGFINSLSPGEILYVLPPENFYSLIKRFPFTCDSFIADASCSEHFYLRSIAPHFLSAFPTTSFASGEKTTKGILNIISSINCGFIAGKLSVSKCKC
jgi:hypothetical protein